MIPIPDRLDPEEVLAGVCATCKQQVVTERRHADPPKKGPVQDRYKADPMADLPCIECPYCVESSPSKTGPKVYLFPRKEPAHPPLEQAVVLSNEERDIALGYGKRVTLSELLESRKEK